MIGNNRGKDGKMLGIAKLMTLELYTRLGQETVVLKSHIGKLSTVIIVFFAMTVSKG